MENPDKPGTPGNGSPRSDEGIERDTTEPGTFQAAETLDSANNEPNPEYTGEQGEGTKQPDPREPTHLEITFRLDRNPVRGYNHMCRFELNCQDIPTALKLLAGDSQGLKQYAIAELYTRLDELPPLTLRELFGSNNINILPNSYIYFTIMNQEQEFEPMDKALADPENVHLRTSERKPYDAVMQVEAHIVTVPDEIPPRNRREVDSLMDHHREIVWTNSQRHMLARSKEWFLFQETNTFEFPRTPDSLTHDFHTPKFGWRTRYTPPTHKVKYDEGRMGGEQQAPRRGNYFAAARRRLNYERFA